MAPIAVIGASGGVGRAAVKQLLQQERDVRAIGRSKAKLQKLFGTSDRLQIVEASVEDKESLTAALDGVSGVINACAGYESVLMSLCCTDALVSCCERMLLSSGSTSSSFGCCFSSRG